MKISVVIPILYASHHQLYRKAMKRLETSWKKSRQSAHGSLEVILVFNQVSLGENISIGPSKYFKIHVLANTLNRGFTGAVNDGVWFAAYQQKADWCLVLNDDALVDPDFFQEILPELKNSRAVISCGVKNADGSIQSIGLKYFSSGLAKPLAQYSATPFFAGTVFFVSRSIIHWSFERFGWLLIEFFFAYAEDVELSIRLIKNHKKVYIHPETLVTHLGSMTARRGSDLQLYWGYRNLLFLVLVHWRWQYILTSFPLLFFGQLFVIVVLLSKGYWLVYPKILWSIWKNRLILRFYRKTFNEKLTYSYPV